MMTQARRRHNQDLWDRCWKNQDGDYVIYQHPNLPLIAWALLMVVSIVLTGTASNIAWYAGLVALAVWGVWEVWKGVNYFRRLLGAVVLVLIVLAAFKVGY